MSKKSEKKQQKAATQLEKDREALAAAKSATKPDGTPKSRATLSVDAARVQALEKKIAAADKKVAESTAKNYQKQQASISKEKKKQESALAKETKKKTEASKKQSDAEKKETALRSTVTATGLPKTAAQIKSDTAKADKMDKEQAKKQLAADKKAAKKEAKSEAALAKVEAVQKKMGMPTITSTAGQSSESTTSSEPAEAAKAFSKNAVINAIAQGASNSYPGLTQTIDNLKNAQSAEDYAQIANSDELKSTVKAVKQDVRAIAQNNGIDSSQSLPAMIKEIKERVEPGSDEEKTANTAAVAIAADQAANSAAGGGSNMLMIGGILAAAGIAFVLLKGKNASR